MKLIDLILDVGRYGSPELPESINLFMTQYLWIDTKVDWYRIYKNFINLKVGNCNIEIYPRFGEPIILVRGEKNSFSKHTNYDLQTLLHSRVVVSNGKVEFDHLSFYSELSRELLSL